MRRKGETMRRRDFFRLALGLPLALIPSRGEASTELEPATITDTAHSVKWSANAWHGETVSVTLGTTSDTLVFVSPFRVEPA